MKTSKTVLSPEVQMLQTQLAAQKAQLLSTKKMLKQVEQANKPPFIETKFGRGYLTVIKTVTKPFVSMNKSAETALEDPDLYRCNEIVAIGNKLVEKARACKDNKQPESLGLVASLAKLGLSVKMFNEKTETRFENIIVLLENVTSEIERLRPERTEAQKTQEQEFKAQLTKIAEQVEAAKVVAVEESTQAKE